MAKSITEIKKVKYLKNFAEFRLLLVNFITNSNCRAAHITDDFRRNRPNYCHGMLPKLLEKRYITHLICVAKFEAALWVGSPT